MKKIVALVAVAAFVLSVVPALAFYQNTSSDVTVNTSNSGTFVSNDVVTVAKTGNNSANSGSVLTGDAYASSVAQNSVNGTDVGVYAPCTSCRGNVSVGTSNSGTFVKNDVMTAAKTGNNNLSTAVKVYHHRQQNSDGVILTGNSNSYSSAVNYVNQTIVRVAR